MKNIILLSLLILLNNCNAQKKNSQLPQKYMQNYNEDQYKDWQFDLEHCNPKYNKKCSRQDYNVYLMKGNERIQITNGDDIISVERSNIITPYIFAYDYNAKTKIISASFNFFYSSALAPIGISKEYNEYGKVIKEKDWNKPYKFSIEDLIQKFKNEYKVDIENRKNIHKVFRFDEIKELNTSMYKVSLNTEVENEWIYYLIDGNTGKTLYERRLSYGDEVDIIEEYLKSIGKFKGTPSKSNPETSQRSSPLSNEELGKSYAYGQAVPQNIHQIYDGKAYTKTEWDTFQKSLPWWKKIL